MVATIRFAPTGPVAAKHLHPRQSERHELRAGDLHLDFDRRRGPLAAGEPVTVPVGTPHRIWNRTGEHVELLVEATPALRSDEFLATLVRVRRPGRLADWNPLRLAAIAAAFPEESNLASPSPRAQRAMIRAISPLARRVEL